MISTTDNKYPYSLFFVARSRVPLRAPLRDHFVVVRLLKCNNVIFGSSKSCNHGNSFVNFGFDRILIPHGQNGCIFNGSL